MRSLVPYESYDQMLRSGYAVHTMHIVKAMSAGLLMARAGRLSDQLVIFDLQQQTSQHGRTTSQHDDHIASNSVQMWNFNEYTAMNLFIHFAACAVLHKLRLVEAEALYWNLRRQQAFCSPAVSFQILS